MPLVTEWDRVLAHPRCVVLFSGTLSDGLKVDTSLGLCSGLHTYSMGVVCRLLGHLCRVVNILYLCSLPQLTGNLFQRDVTKKRVWDGSQAVLVYNCAEILGDGLLKLCMHTEGSATLKLQMCSLCIQMYILRNLSGKTDWARHTPDYGKPQHPT